MKYKMPKTIAILVFILFFGSTCISSVNAISTSTKVTFIAPLDATNSTGFAFFTGDCREGNTNVWTTSYKALNVFSDGAFYSGCPVTTYTYSGSHYQGWRIRTVYSGNNYSGEHCSVYTPGNSDVYSLQIRRIGSSPLVNIATLSNNYLRDVNMLDALGNGIDWFMYCKIYTEPRYIHTSNMYLSLGSSLSGYPGNYLNWTSSYSNAQQLFFMYLGNGAIASYWSFDNSRTGLDY